MRLDLIASSTLVRAVETADIVAQGQQNSGGAAVLRSTHSGLAEMFYGSLEGRPISETRSELKQLSEAWAGGRTDVAVGGDGESPDTLLARAHMTLWGDARDSVLGRCEVGSRVACVAHSTFNRAVLSVALGKGLGHMFAIPQDNACINVLEYDHAGGGVQVLAINVRPDNTLGYEE